MGVPQPLGLVEGSFQQRYEWDHFHYDAAPEADLAEHHPQEDRQERSTPTPAASSNATVGPSNVQRSHIQLSTVGFNEFPPWSHLVSHKNRENPVGFQRILNFHTLHHSR